MTGWAHRGGSLVIILALLAACGSESDPPRAKPAPSSSSSSPSTTEPPRHGPDYVAIGDSYTAGGPISSLQPGGSRCQRSSVNYPSLVARRLDLPLTDVSCIAATTASVLQGGGDLPAQATAITPRTRAVTVGIGGNDFGMYGTLILTCSNLSKPGGAGAPCRDRLSGEVAADLPKIGGRVRGVLAEVHRKAPHAELLLVGYPRLMPVRGSCAHAPYTAGDVAWVSSLESDLSATLARAARSAGATFVPMYQRSKGHDLCGREPWVNGLHPANGDGIVLHPNAAGERAIAGAVVAALRKTSVA